jgi:hypothetical protein
MSFVHLPRFFSLFTGALGIVIFVAGIFVPIFATYWNGVPYSQNGTSYYVGGSFFKTEIYKFRLWQNPPAAYTVSLTATQPIHIVLVENSSSMSIRDLGTARTFFKSFIIWRGNWTMFLTAPEDVQEFNFGLTGGMETGYPLLTLSKEIVPVLFLAGVGLTFLFFSRKEIYADVRSLIQDIPKRYLFISFLSPVLLILDSIFTYEAIQKSAFVYENNRMIVAAYQAGTVFGIILEACFVLLSFATSVVAIGLLNDSAFFKKMFGSALLASMIGSFSFTVLWDLLAFGLPIVLGVQGPLLPRYVSVLIGAVIGIVTFTFLFRASHKASMVKNNPRGMRKAGNVFFIIVNRLAFN